MPNRIPLVVDTDAFNGIDDQFVIACALSCPGTGGVLALLAAQLFNEKSASPGIAWRRASGRSNASQFERARPFGYKNLPAR